MVRKPPFKRLYENIYININGCWVWRGQTTKKGYGQIKAFDKIVLCHRLSYELHFGHIQEKMEVAHTCDNPPCVNPDHLVLMTHQENMADMDRKGRRRQGKPNPRRGAENSQAIQVQVLGKVYGSIKEAEKELSLGCGTVRFWIKSQPKKAMIISKKHYLNKGEKQDV